MSKCHAEATLIFKYPWIIPKRNNLNLKKSELAVYYSSNSVFSEKK